MEENKNNNNNNNGEEKRRYYGVFIRMHITKEIKGMKNIKEAYKEIMKKIIRK
jgi:hypothetical protein